MDHRISVGILFLFPAAILGASWPRRRAVAWVLGAGFLLYWAQGFLRMGSGHGETWLAAGLLAALACLYSIRVCLRGASEHERSRASEAARLREMDRVEQLIAAAKDRGKDIEVESREVLALYSLVKGLSEALSWNDLRPILDTAVRQYLGQEEFALYVAEANSERLRPLVRRGLGVSAGASWDTLQRLFQERALPMGVSHILESPEHALALPIFEDQKRVGYFYVRLPPGLDARAALAKAQTFVDEISFAFRRIILFQEVEQLSQVDGVTGLFRRGVFEEKLKEELVRAQTFKTTFCLLLLDIDHFKKLNDTYGHPFGDQVLGRVGELLRDNVYDTDLVARYGGEEFVILMSRADASGVLRKAEALRKAIETEVFVLAMEKIHVTVSIGVAHYPRDGASAEMVLRQADRAMYYVKETGRNRVADISAVKRT